MPTYMVIFFAAMVLAIAVTPLAKKLALTTGTVDKPGARKIHSVPIPLLGGLGIYLAFILTVLVFGDFFRIPQLASIVLGASLVSFMGIWDDSKGLRPLVKLLCQVVAAVILILSDIYVSIFPVPILNYLITILWVVGITNSLNLLDNMDGLSGGIAAVCSAFFLLMAAVSGQYLVAMLAAAILGACVGFLRYNFNPASIFMGDTGSLFLGFMLAALGIKLRFDNTSVVTWMVPVIVLGLPIFDTTLVTLSRLRRGLNPLTTPGKDHLSHRLVAMGMTNKEAVLSLYLMGGSLGLVAFYVTKASLVEAYIIAAVLILVCLIALFRLERVDYIGKHNVTPSVTKTADIT